jgi:hypothetical protein
MANLLQATDLILQEIFKSIDLFPEYVRVTNFPQIFEGRCEKFVVI